MANTREMAIINGVEVDVTTVIDKTTTYNPTYEECSALISKGTELLEYYFPNANTEDMRGLDVMFNPENGTFWAAKGWMINAFSRHPGYNGKYQIVLNDETVSRGMEYTNINQFFDWCYERLDEREFYSYEGKIVTYEEICKIRKSIRLKKAEALGNNNPTEYEMWDQKMMTTAKQHTKEDEFFRSVLEEIRLAVRCGKMENLLTDEIATKVNELAVQMGVEYRTSAGQKVSKLVNKTAAICGMNKIVDVQTINWVSDDGVAHSRTKDMGWNQKFAAFADAINPQDIKGRVIISCNPIDYWTMSFGANWASCHTIDMENIRRANGPHYSGCFCGGTESYMGDMATFIAYTVAEDYTGDEYEMQDKIKRCVFYLGEDKLVQSRLYPDGRDGGDNTIAASMRAIVQKVIAQIFDVPNLWTIKRGTMACAEVTESYGVHYQDYNHYDDCNVSYMKRIDGHRNIKRIRIGTDPICPNCGDRHHTENNIFCGPCSSSGYTCADCGCYVNDDEVCWVGDNPYCPDCVVLCEHCNEYEREGRTRYLSNYNITVCNWCLENHYTWCEYDDEYVLNGDVVETEEGNHYAPDSEGYCTCGQCGEVHDYEGSVWNEAAGDWNCEWCFDQWREEHDREEANEEA